MTRTSATARLPGAYWRIWWATGIDTVGNGAFVAAIPLLTVAITRDPRLVSLITATTYLPWLLLSLPAGSLVDRRDRVGLMWQSQAAQAVLVGALAIFTAFHAVDIVGLAVLSFASGACNVVYSNAAQAALPDFVSTSLLHKANGYQQTVTAIGQQFAGPPLGSLLFAVTAALPFGVDAASFAVSAVLLAALPRRPPRPAESASARAEMAAGVRWLMRQRLLRTLAILLGVNTFCGQLGLTTLVLFATEELHLGAGAYGLLLVSAVVGSVIGGLLTSYVVTKLGALRVLLTALAANVAVFVGIGLSPNLVVLAGFLAANGLVTTVWNVITVGVRQELVPSPLLGRVNSVYRMLGWGLIPLGALSGGFIAHKFGLRAPYPVAGVLRGIALLATLPVLLPAMRAELREAGRL